MARKVLQSSEVTDSLASVSEGVSIFLKVSFLKTVYVSNGKEF